jgi:preprotein translocase subunit Sec61beta
MKRHIPYILSMLFLFISLLGPASYAGASDLAVSNGVPGMVSYQGQVNVDGRPISGPGYYFKFAIIGPPGTTSYWSNDGTSTAGSQPTHAVTLPVSNGLFNVLLGDAGVGMSPLTAVVFSEPVRLLRVWFSQDGSTYTLLVPDRPVASVPYALQAQLAADSIALNGHPAGDFMIVSQYLGRRWGTRVDTAGDVGEHSSITLGADGLGLVSYYDYDNGDLKVLHCGNLFCTSNNTATSLDTTGDVGLDTSITIGADGLGLISYYDHDNGDLKVLHCGDLSCTSGNTITSVDKTGDVGEYTSITIGVDGLGLVSYYDNTNGHLKVLHCGNLLCSSGNTSTSVDMNSQVGYNSTSITIGGDGLGLISYWDYGKLDLKVLHCGNLLCSSGNTSTSVDTVGDVGGYNSITIGADGFGLISYFDNTNGDLKVLHCGNPQCNSNTSTSVDTTGDVGLYNSITIGADGLGLVTYQDITNFDLKVLHCGNQQCISGNTKTSIDTYGDVGGVGNSITIGADGLGLISCYDHTNGDLKVIKLSGLGRR